jgi:hypothetical protein
MAKEVDGNDLICGLIRTGYVELGIFYGGQQHWYQATSSLDPTVQHSMAISIIENNAKVWVDGTLYINQPDDWLNASVFNEGYIGLYTPGCTGEFDYVAVLNAKGYYTITASAGVGGSISPAGTVQVAENANKSFIITPQIGYRAKVSIDGVDQGNLSSYTFTNVTANHTISAQFIQTYTITSNSVSSGGTVSPAGSIIMDQGTDRSFTIATTSNCYQITDIVIDENDATRTIHLGTQTSPYVYTFENIQSNHTISATFTLGSSSYRPITLGVNGVATLPPNVTFVIDGTNYTSGDMACLSTSVNHLFSVSPTTSDVYGNYSFEKWDVLDGGANHVRYEYCNPLAMQVTSSTQFLVAMYTSESTMYTVTTSGGSNGTITPSQATVLQGSCATFKITSASGYQLQTLQYNGNDVKNNVVNGFITVDVQGSGTLVASFSSSPTYTITASVSGGGGSIYPPGESSVSAGGSLTFTLTPNTGYHLSDLVRDGSSVLSSVVNNQYTASNVNANSSLTAYFIINTYTITATAGSNGSISPSGQVNVTAGSSQAFTITPTIGHSILTVTVDGTSVGAVSTYQFTDIQANHTIQATFQNVYAITSAAGTGGTISPSGTTLVNQGGSQSYTITPNAGYSILTVIVNGSPQGAINTYTFTNVQAPQTIQTTFQQLTYDIVSTAGTGGSISPSGGTIVNYGGSQSYSITPNYGYLIADVTVDGASQGAISGYTFINVQTNHTISATFEYCQSCYECQTACDICQTCYTCQTSCELSCQTGCEVACQTTCENACQTGCQVSCQTGCEISCQSACQVSCQATCELACQTGCQVSCQTGCEVTCQTGCQVSCQSCNTCQTTCELSCQTGCQVACQTGCEVNCQNCQNCQTPCEANMYCPTYGCSSCVTCEACYNCEICQSVCQNCQTGCQVVCQDCQTGCQTCVSCQMGEYCQPGSYECPSCETCQPGYT